MQTHPKTKAAYQLLHEGTLAFGRAEQAGMRIDINYCQQKKEELTERIKILEKEILDSKFGKHWRHSTSNKGLKVAIHPQIAIRIYSNW